MTKPNRTQRLLKPLLARHDDLVFAGPFLIVKPVEHVMRGIILDRTSSRTFFHARWAMSETFMIRDSIPLNYGEWVFENMHPGMDFFDLPEAEISARLCERIEAATLPMLRTVKTFSDYCSFWIHRESPDDIRRPSPMRAAEYFRLLLGMGEFDAARTVRDTNIEAWKRNPVFFTPDAPDGNIRLRTLSELLDRNDYDGIACQYRDREAITARLMKLEKVWRPTPFPFEAA